MPCLKGGDRGAHSILALDCVRNFSVKDFLEGTDKGAEEHFIYVYVNICTYMFIYNI